MNDKVSLHEKNNKNNECGTEYKTNLNFLFKFRCAWSSACQNTTWQAQKDGFLFKIKPLTGQKYSHSDCDLHDDH